jgi:hypothetical protein
VEQHRPTCQSNRRVPSESLAQQSEESEYRTCGKYPQAKWFGRLFSSNTAWIRGARQSETRDRGLEKNRPPALQSKPAGRSEIDGAAEPTL